MVLGIGIDSVEIERFSHWVTLSHKQLSRILSQSEIDYCRSQPHKMAERCAVRFAAREALYKALCHIPLNRPMPFLTLCKKTTIIKNSQGVPIIECDWDWLQNYAPRTLIFHLSMTHTNQMATAIVILSQEII